MLTVEAQTISKLIDLLIYKAVFERTNKVNIRIEPDTITVILGVQYSDDF